MPKPLSWIEVDREAIAHNLRQFAALLPTQTKLMAVVKGEAYGHGMLEVAKTAVRAGADWLGVFHLGEAAALRKAGIEAPLLVLGYVPLSDFEEAVSLDASVTVSSLETLDAAARAGRKVGKKARLHLKLETGTHRLGLEGEHLREAAARIRADEWLMVEGAHTHFANIEDTTEHDFARAQLERFRARLGELRAAGLEVPFPHTACSAATILFPETYFSLVRVGIGMYGLWPSKETYLSAFSRGKDPIQLKPAMTWKTRVIQVKEIPSGAYVGYGLTYRTTRPTLLAILPIGYANGYDRQLSNRAHVLIGGVRAPVRGRVCMNLCMVDVTDLPAVHLEDEVVILGRSQDEQISAEQIASWAQTINYEVVTRADPTAPRVYVSDRAQPR
jgi:alanine racemase